MRATKKNHYAYNKELQPIANSLRSNATKAEACLWKYILRAGQMKGYSFRRQRPALKSITDFMCQPLMLIIEVDGGVHKEEQVAAKDLERQRKLEAAGFAILRFTNVEVLYCIDEVRTRIAVWIEDYEWRRSDLCRERPPLA